MPEAGVPARARQRYAAPWWEELDREAFRFPAAQEVNRVHRATSERPASAAAPVAVPVAAPPVRGGLPEPDGLPYGQGGRRTVTITGRGAERNLPMARPTLRKHERPGFRPDRAALWAVILGLVLILVAVASAHGAVVH